MRESKKPSEVLPTDPELPARLKDLADSRTWKEFHDTYRNLIFGTAKKRGLTDSEAEDVLQETLIWAAGHIHNFEYDPSKSFKGWLLQITRWRAQDQIRKRTPVAKGHSRPETGSVRTKTVERIPAPTGPGLEEQWDTERDERIREMALAHVRRTVKNAKHFQIFAAYVIKGWSMDDVVSTFKVKENNVSKIKSRIVKKLSREVARLKKQQT